MLPKKLTDTELVLLSTASQREDGAVELTGTPKGLNARCPYRRNGAISRHFERDPIPYALDSDWPVGAGEFEPLHLKIGIAKTLSLGREDIDYSENAGLG